MESKLEQVLRFQIAALGLPEPEHEFLFCPGRRWRFDFCWPDENIKLAVECNGATWVKGAHSSGYGLRRDYDKLNHAQLLGYIVLQFDSNSIYDGSAVSLIQKALEGRKAK